MQSLQVTEKLFEFFPIFYFSTEGHFVQQSRIMVGNHNGTFRNKKYALRVPFRGTSGAFQRKMVGEGFEAADNHDGSGLLK